MKEDPIKGDWINLVKTDLEVINLSLEDEREIENMTSEEFKALLKRKFRDKAFEELEDIKSEHIKVKHIKHTNLNGPQEYLTSDKLDNKTKADLFNLRSESHRSFKDNFHNMYEVSDCPMCKKYADSQLHALACKNVAQQLDKDDQEML